MQPRLFGAARTNSPDIAPLIAAPAAPVPTVSDAVRSRMGQAHQRWKERLMQNADLVAGATGDESDDQILARRSAVKEALSQIAVSDPLSLGSTERTRVIDDIAAEIVGYGPLEGLLADDGISEIMVNGPRQVYIERNGRIEKTDIVFRSEEALLATCRRIVEAVERKVDAQNPMCDARLADGSRVNVVIAPISVDGTILTIRKFKKEKLRLVDLVRFGSITPAASEILRILGRCRLNIVISGGTGSGKTTLLNCLTGSIDASERILTCEDTAELQLQQPHVVRLETRPASNEGAGEVTMRALVKNALRMKPHRIIVGEVRDDAAIDLIQAMNTGHLGSMGTVHANDPRGCLSRLEALIRTGSGYHNLPAHIIRTDLVNSIHLVVQTQQLVTGQRVITEVAEVHGLEGETFVLNPILKYDHQHQRLRGTGVLRPRFLEATEPYGEQKAAMEALVRANAETTSNDGGRP